MSPSDPKLVELATQLQAAKFGLEDSLQRLREACISLQCSLDDIDQQCAALDELDSEEHGSEPEDGED